MTELDLSPDLACCRSYLLAIARFELPRYLGRRAEVSDVVQQTLLEAHRDRAQFKDHGDGAKFRQWLRKILAHNLANIIRYHLREKRDVNREVSLEQSLGASSARLELWLADLRTPPPDRAVRNERLLALTDALLGLPDAQREAVELRYLQGLSIKEIAGRMEKTSTAVAALICRGVKELKKRLGGNLKGK